jgi:hypothetical protein
MGCIARLGCLIVLVVLVAAAWITRALWLPERYRPHATATSPAVAGWEPITSAGADRTRAALEKLNEPRGQAFQTLSSSDLASYAIHALTPRLSGAVDSIETKVSGESVTMRASVRVSDLGGAASFGPLAGMLGDREPVELTGTFRVVRPGLAEFDVQDAKIRNFPIPRAMIPTLMKKIGQGARPAGLSETGLALPIPRYIGDIRVANGKVTLYKSVQ